ncbi:MAG: Crp/Fnr family transcriptional regulator [Anaerocolumna sp.]
MNLESRNYILLLLLGCEEYMEAYIKVLESHPLFKGTSIPMNEILTELKCKIKKYKKDEYIILAGDTITSFGILLDGEARIIREDIMGNCVIIADLMKGEIFAETFVCADVKFSPVSVISEKDCKVLWIFLDGIKSEVLNKIGTGQIIMGNLLKLLAAKNLHLNRKMEILSKRTIREKFMAYLNFLAQDNQSPTFILPLNRNELALYLCVDRSALSREIMKLKNEEIIIFQKEYITILKEAIEN